MPSHLQSIDRVKKIPANTNTIRFDKITRIRIRILFGFKKSSEYEYEYYSVKKNHPNTNTNTIRFEKITRIRIRILVFGLNYSNSIRIPNYLLTYTFRKYTFRKYTFPFSLFTFHFSLRATRDWKSESV